MKEKKPNILFLASWYPNTESPQAGNFIQQHARAISEYANIAVIHVVPIKDLPKTKITTEWNNGIYEVVVYYKKTSTTLPILCLYDKAKKQKAAYNLAYQAALKEFNQFNLVHLNVVYPAGLFALHLKATHNIPFIITEHWTAFQKTTQNSFNAIEKYFIKKITRQAEIICPVSNDLKNALIDFGIKNKFQVIPNVVNTAIFQPQLIQNKKVKILHISNLKDEHKNISGILRVIEKLSLQRSDFTLTIAGNGDIDNFREKAKQLSISNDIIHFEGEKTPEEVAHLMNNNDAFLLFSNYENLPCVIAESLVMGLPVLTTDVGGISEMINQHNGILVNKGNETELFKELNNLIDNINSYKSTDIANNAKDIYSYKTVGKSYFSIYESILN